MSKRALGRTQRAVLESVRDHRNPMVTLNGYPDRHSYEAYCRRRAVTDEMVKRGYIRSLSFGNPEVSRLHREAVERGGDRQQLPIWSLTSEGVALLGVKG